MDDIWDNYDSNHDGVLDKDETKKFVLWTMTLSAVENEFNEDAFEHVFDEMDSNSTGTVDKKKMIKFIFKHILNNPQVLDQIIDDLWGLVFLLIMPSA